MIKLPKLPANALVHGADVNKIIDALASSLQIHCGPGLEARFTSSGQYVNLISTPLDMIRNNAQGDGGSGRSSSSDSFYAEVVDYEVYSVNQWTYSIRRLTKVTGDYTGWTREGKILTAFNTCEDMNSDAGLQGNGVDIDGTAMSGFDLQPAPVGCIVRIFRQPYTGPPGDVEYWFSYENGIDGECP